MEKKINVNNLLRDATAIMLMTCILIVEGCFNFVDMSFTIEKITQVTFIVFIILRVVILVMLKSATMMMATPRFRDTSEALRTERETNLKYLKLRESDFTEYIVNVRNRQLKIDAWKAKINKKLDKLDRKASLKDKELLFKKDLTDYEKEQSSYYRKRSYLLTQLDDNWIDENYHILPMRKGEYQHINPSIFDIPVSVEEGNKIYQMVSKTKSATVAAIASSALTMVFMQTLIRMVEFGTLEGDGIGLFVSLMTDLLFMISQVAQGISNSYNIIQQQEVIPYSNRNRELKDYIYWKHPEKYNALKEIITQIEGKA